jgi:hypothetical protein
VLRGPAKPDLARRGAEPGLLEQRLVLALLHACEHDLERRAPQLIRLGIVCRERGALIGIDVEQDAGLPGRVNGREDLLADAKVGDIEV